MTDDHLSYKRSKFFTRLPTDRLYTESHFWLGRDEDGEDRWRIGFTKFATRMLGEIVEFDFEVAAGAPVGEGQTIGWFEGFKAVTELYTPMAGTFVGPNPNLDAVAERIHSSPYGEAWLYAIAGTPPDTALDAEGYAAFLDGTIDRMLGKSA